MNRQRLPVTLLIGSIVVIVISAIAPAVWADWLLENAVVAVALPLFVFGYRRLRLSNASYVSLFVFLILHETGAHYTYSNVPYDQWFADAFGVTLNSLLGLTRNDFDRLVHFSYGLLITPAAADLLAQRAPPRGIWRWILPVTFIMSHALIYELVEWAAATAFGGDLGQEYLGTQGDPWDAQQDMLLASLGSIVSMLFLGLTRRLPVEAGVPINR
ncbi:putative membrane protein [Luteibacter jiangsuensis]|uniref:Membrane protein n=1 Tax=Luteibacter jiangsuensis TaxID=637577 RepID=A0ABT9SX47_9GAMM|nr:DUF2238 domain-containing protein [Luteibacter jiangsuensis]MDQ0009114.1 putative membrane protein [Luteibacter jiangsuensis]